MRKQTLLLFLAGALLFFAGPALGQSPDNIPQEDREKAAALFQKAEAYYTVQEFDKALELYKEAYLLSLQPELIFNMAQCYRQMGRYEEALKSYRSFLRQLPDTPLKENVEKLIADTEALLASSREGGSPALPATAPVAPPPKNPETGSVVVGTGPTEIAPDPEPPKERAGLPGSSKLLFGLAAGSGAVGLIVGAQALASADLTLDFETTLEMDQVRFTRSRAVAQAIVSDMFLVGALVSGGFGVLKALKAKKARSEPRLTLSPRGASLSLRF